MGNQSSSGGGGGSSGSTGNSGGTNTGNPHHSPTMTLPTFRLPQLTTGSLKLSRAELDRRSQPSGLYPTTPWEPRAIRRLIGDGKLAARLKGTDGRVDPADQECPICFLHYGQVNLTKCCAATVCTECYLQVRPQKDKHNTSHPCPFCNAPKLSVKVAKTMTGGQVRQRETEEQLVIEAQIEAQKTGLTGEGGNGGDGSHHSNNSQDSTTFGRDADNNEDPSTPQPYRAVGGGGNSTAPNTPNTPPVVRPPGPGEFGAAIERYRSESFASASSDGVGGGGPNRDRCDTGGSLTLTPTQRSQIHAQLQSQNDHPLARQMADEARQRREDNEMEYYRANSGRLLERYEEYRSRARQSRAMADRMLLQAHGIPARGGGGSGSGGPGTTTILAPRNGSGGLDSMVMEALMLSIEEDAERQRRREAEEASGDGDGGGGEEGEGGGGATPSAAAIQQPSLAALLAPSSSSSRSGPGGVPGSRRRLLRARGGARGGPPTSTHIGTAGMLMQGISEEDQVAMAIALSLREAETAQNDNDDGADGGGASEGSSNTNGDENGSGGHNNETEDAQDANTEEEEGVGEEDRT